VRVDDRLWDQFLAGPSVQMRGEPEDVGLEDVLSSAKPPAMSPSSVA